MGGRGSLRGDGAGGRERESLEAWNKGAGALGGSLRAWGGWGLEGAGVWGAGAWGDRMDIRTFVRTFNRSDGWKFPLRSMDIVPVRSTAQKGCI